MLRIMKQNVLDYHDMRMDPDQGQWHDIQSVLYHCLPDFLLDHNMTIS
jgi:hypothetical protein